MSQLNSIAKPYARAAFDFAYDKGIVSDWLAALQDFDSFLKSSEISDLLDNPSLTQSQIVSLIEKNIIDAYGQHFCNFIKLVASSQRLGFFSNVYSEYETLMKTRENLKTAEITTAYPLSDEAQSNIKNKLKARFNCEIDLNLIIDTSLVAGAIIKVDDTVIDGAISDRLDRLNNVLISQR